MRKILLISAIIYLSGFFMQLSAQSLSSSSKAVRSNDRLKFGGGDKINAEELFALHPALFGLRRNVDMMKQTKRESDRYNFTHHRLQQYYKGIPVEGGEYILHEYKGVLQTANGRFIKGIDIDINPGISAEEATERAISYMRREFNAEAFRWESADDEKMLKKITNNMEATYYPMPELVIVSRDYSRDGREYILAYKMEVYASKPLMKLMVFTDANTGEIYHTLNLLRFSDRKAFAQTQYDDVQIITADSVAPDIYRLRETLRGKGIMTYSMNNGLNYSLAEDVVSATLNFTNDKVANSAHWGAEKTYDYYFQKFGRNSYDDKGSPLISYVHYGKEYLNAYWDGKCMTYGDGSASYGYGPFTALDVCGHEITHAVTDATSKLIYQGEPGALDETFADIFGTAVEFFSMSKPDWTIGEDLSQQPLRSLSNPGKYKYPTTYKGKNWAAGKDDYGGVHTNCSVGGLWFYLLSEGGTGTNDNGWNYDVTGIGMESAEKIAYRTMTSYLTSTSDFTDAYFGSMQAAEDLYGKCSPEQKQTAEAWYAVGVGYRAITKDIYITHLLSPVSGFGLGEEKVTVNLYYAGCDSVLEAGREIALAYRLDTGIKVFDTLKLAKAMEAGDSVQYTFAKPADAGVLGTHKLSVWAKLIDTTKAYNDSIIGYQFTNKAYQNVDVGAVAVTSPVSGCGMTSGEKVTFKFTFFGADSVPANDTIAVSYKINDLEPVVENFITSSPVKPKQIITYTFKTPADISGIFGTVKLLVKTQYSKDTINSNDAVAYTFINPASAAGKTITFEDAASSDYYYSTSLRFSRAYVSAIAKYQGKNGFLMTGSPIRNPYKDIHIPNDSNIWTINTNHSAKLNFCVDATAWKHVNLKFNLRQTSGGATYTQFLGNADYSKASSLRILAEGKQTGGTYNPKTYTQDAWKPVYLNLDSFAGKKFQLTFESRCIGKDTSLFGSFVRLDNVYLDNIIITEESLNSINEPGIAEPEAVLFPVPAGDRYFISMQSDASHQIAIATFDIYGRLVETGEMKVNSGSNIYSFTTEGLCSGIYLVRLTGKYGVATLKLIKR